MPPVCMVIVDPGRFIEIITAFLHQGGKTPGFRNVVAPRAGAFSIAELPDIIKIRYPAIMTDIILHIIPGRVIRNA